MGTLTSCKRDQGLSATDLQRMRALRDEHVIDGLSAQDAAVEASKDLEQKYFASRAKIVEQVEKAGGVAQQLDDQKPIQKITDQKSGQQPDEPPRPLPVSGPQVREEKRKPAAKLSTKITAPAAKKAGKEARGEATKSALAKAGLISDDRGIAQKVKDAVSENWEPDWKDRFVQGTFDRFFRIKRLQDTVGAFSPEQDAYISSRMSNGSAAIMRAVMLHGAPVLKDGIIIQVKPDSKGLLEILKPVQENLTEWLGWKVGRRAERLKREGKENNLSNDDIKELKSLVPKGMEEKFETASKEYQALSDAVLDVAAESGMIDQGARAMWQHGDHIPFYREGTLVRGKGRQGLAGQASGIFKLRGGKAALRDPLTNILANFGRLIDGSLKNKALLQTIDNLKTVKNPESLEPVLEPVTPPVKPQRIGKSQIKKSLIDSGVPKEMLDAMPPEAFKGMQTFFSRKPPTDPDVIRVMRNGKPEYYRVNDELLLRSLTGINMEPLSASAPFRPFKRLLTAGVTSMPDFMARNFTRDALHAWMITEGKFTPGWDSARGLFNSFREDGGTIDMMMSGSSFMGGYLNSTDPDSMAKVMRETLREKGFVPKDINQFIETVLHPVSKIWAKWRRVGDAIENANRRAVVESELGRTGSKTKALFEGRDLMDFGLTGDWKAIRFFVDVLPFFNARLQSEYKLVRAGAIPFANMRNKVVMRGGTITVASLALLAQNWDNEAYEELEEWDKDAFWHIAPGTPMHTRIPKPFELGLIFGTIPERLVRFGLGRDDTKEATAAFLHGLGETFALNPIPQAVKPIVELVANKDFFTDRPIEGLSDIGKLPSARYNESTSPTLRALGSVTSDTTGLSPKQMEHLVRGYTGTLGTYVVAAADMATRFANDMPVKPTRTIRQVPVVGSFFRGDNPPYSTASRTALYDILKESEQNFRTMQAFRQQGKIDEAMALLEEKEGLIRVRKPLARAAKQLSGLRKQMDRVYRDKEMSAQNKRKQIDALLERRNAVAKQAVEWADTVLEK